MSVSANRVFMIGWEYPPHNSGGLGVACEGLTQALHGAHQAKINFTLPYSPASKFSHMNILECVDPSWLDEKGNKAPKTPPFSVYHSSEAVYKKITAQDMDRYKLTTLPQSELETKVDQYADRVLDMGVPISRSYDVIHAHDWMSFPAGIRLKHKTKKPLITHIHSTEHDRTALGAGSPYISHTEYQGVHLADRVIAVSYYTKRLLVEKYGADPKKIDVVHNGINPLTAEIDRGWHHFANKRPVVAFMGRLTLHKGVDYFLEVARYVLAQIPEVLFVVAGSGDLYHELMFKTAGNGLSASVLFSGFIRDKQKERLLNRADVFMMPSISEPFGIVALEAAQRHIPVIISKNAGVSEVMPSSLALDFWDVKEMGNAVVRLLKDQGFAQEVRTGQLHDLKEVTWENAAKKVNSVYRKAFLG